MITQPSCAQLIAAVRAELQTTVAPATADQHALIALGMIDSVLATVAARCDRGPGVMAEEIEDVLALAEQLMPDGVAGRDELASATDIDAQYVAAGHLLNRCIDVAADAGPEMRALAGDVVFRRVDRAAQIHGALDVHGR